MSPQRNADTRSRLLTAAAELIAASPGQDVPLRAICDRVEVRLPTLYHFFGSKEGLFDAVIEHGFDLYLAVKEGHEGSGDPIQDIRNGWDAHIEFGLSNPGFYALMYGQVTPGRHPTDQSRPTGILLNLTRAAAAQGRLVTTPERATEHVLAANIGVTLRQIVMAEPDPGLSTDMREAVIAAITGTRTADPVDATRSISSSAADLLDRLADSGELLGEPETVLLRKWLATLARNNPAG